MSTDLATVEPHALTADQQAAILRHLNLDPSNVNTQALLLICSRYGLDPLLKHVVLIQGRPYVTRDGYLAVAHRSGELDGIEVMEEGDSDDHWWARVAVHRKDMSRPFTYVGRYPHNGGNKNYGPEMAVKVAEVQALRRAFNVTGIGAADEKWDDAATAEPAPPLDPRVAAMVERYEALTPEQRAPIDEWTASADGQPIHPADLPGPGGWWDGMEARLDEAEDPGYDDHEPAVSPGEDDREPTLLEEGDAG